MELGGNVMNIPPKDGLEAPTGYTEYSDKLYPRYPIGDRSTGWPILAALGSYWSKLFAGKGKLRYLYRNNSILQLQNYINYLETLATTSRFECPVFHRRIWYALSIKESDLAAGTVTALKYDGVADYDGEYTYGQTINHNFTVVQIAQLNSITAIFNRPISPTVTYTKNYDFYIEDNKLVLKFNPFLDGRFPIKQLFDSDGAVEDREVILWAFNSYEDWEYLYNHFGYVVKQKCESSESYKDLINALWNGLVGGLAIEDLELFLAAVAGLPAVAETTEVVEKNITEETKKIVVTDKNAYIYPANSNFRFAEGDTVYAGQTLVDTVMVFDLANYDDIVDLIKLPYTDSNGDTVELDEVSDEEDSSFRLAPSLLMPPSTLPAVLVIPASKNILKGDYKGSIGFLNAVAQYDNSELDSAGRAIGKITKLVGAEEDINNFWLNAHTAGVAEDATWLSRLDRISAYVNPAGFTIEQFLRNNAVVIHLRYNSLGTDNLGLDSLRLLRQVLSPEKLLLVVVSYSVEEDTVVLADDDDNIYVDETATAIEEATISMDDSQINYFNVSTCE